MSKSIRALSMIAALAVLTGGTMTLSAQGVAQKSLPNNTQKDKKDDKKEKKAGSIEIYKAKDGFRFRIKGADGKSMAIAVKGMEDKDDVYKVLEEIKETMNSAKPMESK